MQLESDTFNKIAQVICTSYDIRIWRRGRASYSNCPPMGVVGMGERLALFRSQNCRSISIDYRTVNTKTLESLEYMVYLSTYSERAHTLTRTRCSAMTVRGKIGNGRIQTPTLPNPRPRLGRHSPSTIHHHSVYHALWTR